MSPVGAVAATDRRDPLLRNRFVVDVEDLPPIGFTEVHGLAVRVPSHTDRAGGENDSTASGRWWHVGDLIDRIVGSDTPPTRKSTSPNLELRRGVTTGLPLFTWLRDWVDGTADPRTVRIAVLDDHGDPDVGWVCPDAVPVEWTGPTLSAETTAVATETLVLAHDGIDPLDGELT